MRWVKWIGVILAITFSVGAEPTLPTEIISRPEVVAPEQLNAPPTQAVPDEPESPKHSFAPIAGYNPTYKVFFGAGYFLTAPPINFGTHFVITFDRVYQIMTRFKHSLNDRWSYGFDVEYSSGFDPYYGEGGETSAGSLVNIFGTKILTTARLAYHHNEHVTVGPLFNFRLRRETDVNGDANIRLFPDSESGGFGLFQRLDYRDNEDFPHSGFFQESSFYIVPKALISLAGQDHFAQGDLDLAFYHEIQGDFVIAAKFQGGFSLGQPNYLYSFRIGGTDLLRGYLENRFRGRHFYLQQTEARFPLWSIFSGAAFVGFGDATNDVLTSTKIAWGGGIRIGLPPDYVKVARIDVGFGKDQFGVFLDFGQSF